MERTDVCGGRREGVCRRVGVGRGVGGAALDGLVAGIRQFEGNRGCTANAQ